MVKRKLLLTSITVLVLLANIFWTYGPVMAQGSPDGNGNNGNLHFKDKINQADRKAAAANLKAAKLAVQATALPTPADLTARDVAGHMVPDYFGSPNWAYSPLPTGGITVTLLSGGSGYTTPTVTIEDLYGNGTGATAEVTGIGAGGVINTIQVTNAGSGYVAPQVIITDPNPAASGATAVAALDTNLTISGGIRKFVDSLPLLGPSGNNTIGQYIPVAVPDITTYPGSDYYEIALVEYEEKMHTDLDKTRLRGYVQLHTANTPGDGVPLFKPDGITPIFMPDGTTQAVGVDVPHYLGPAIVSNRDKPTRIKFYNLLPYGAPGDPDPGMGRPGDLFIPVDETVMGSGAGPTMDNNGNPINYTQNRAAVHLHGNNTVWISDGTPYQWITPANESTPYPEGVSVGSVPDMWYDPVTHQEVPAGTPGAVNDPGPGAYTIFYTNAQSARLMFYHDHAVGITRLNVYAGEAAPYLIQDNVEKDLREGTNLTGVNTGSFTIPSGIYEIPLVIQDKTWVDPNTIDKTDPTWLDLTQTTFGTTPGTAHSGDLWYPHVYMPAQNPWDPTGTNAYGRWMYGPWFYPPTTNIDFGPVTNEYYDPVNAPWEPPMRPGTPNPSMPGEAFMDTPIVNGTAYPYLEVEAKPYRFRILNAANDRFWNLQLYEADPDVVTPDGRTNTEVKMISAAGVLGLPPDWTPGIPDPNTKGPDWIQIGTEGGFLPKPVVIPSQPLTWNMNAGAFNFAVVAQKSLFLGCAERADVIVDFTQYAGKTLILYNDSPAPVPAYVPVYDYYTGAPDQTANGGSPGTLPGYGPNTRTIMQIRVGGTPPPSTSSPLGGINLKSGGSGYTEPQITIVGGGVITDATATAIGAVDHISLRSPGSNYTSAPTVTISGGSGSGAAATATVSSSVVTGFNLTNGGSGYSIAPGVAIENGGGTGAAANATLTLTGITLDTFGEYFSPPTVVISDIAGTGWGASATAYLKIPPPTYDIAGLEAAWAKGVTGTPTASKRGVFEYSQDPIIIPQAAYNSAYGYSGVGMVTSISLTNGGSGYTSIPAVNIDAPPAGGTQATAIATIDGGGAVSSISITNGGSGYTSAPAVNIDAPPAGGTQAIATATIDTLPSDPALIWVQIFEYSKTFQPIDANGTLQPAITLPIQPKAMHDEMGAVYDTLYGRMSGMLGLEIPATNARVGQFLPYGYAAPPVDVIKNTDTSSEPIGSLKDGTQIWKITHNGVDTHPIHVHLFNAQLINRVGWDGMMMGVDDNELGWKETLRVNPLEQIVIALRPIAPTADQVPFEVPNSRRLIDPSMPEGAVLNAPPPAGWFTPNGTAIPQIINDYINFGWEYVYHCHILAHEEMDMMHGVAFAVNPRAPTNLAYTLTGSGAATKVILTWVDNSIVETSYTVQKSGSSATGPWITLAILPAGTTTYTDPIGKSTAATYYQVFASNTVGYNQIPGFPVVTADSAIAGPITVGQTAYPPPADPTNLTAVFQTGPQVLLTWTDNANNETGFMIERAINPVVGVPTTWTALVTVGPRTGTGTVTYTDTSVVAGNTYQYRVAAVNVTVLSNNWAISNDVSVPLPPLAPTNVIATATRIGVGPNDKVTLTWTDVANETGYTLQMATNAAFTANLVTSIVPADTVAFTTGNLARNTQYYFRIEAFNAAGPSGWANAAPFPVTTP